LYLAKIFTLITTTFFFQVPNLIEELEQVKHLSCNLQQFCQVSGELSQMCCACGSKFWYTQPRPLKQNFLPNSSKTIPFHLAFRMVS